MNIQAPRFTQDSPAIDGMLTLQSQAMDTGETEAPKTRKIKKQIRRGDLPLSAGTASLDQAAKEAATEKEHAMIMEDKLVADTEDKKNELESFIYELRGKIDEQYAEFASDEEKDKVRSKCTEVEVSLTWLKYRSVKANLFRTGFMMTATTAPKPYIRPRSRSFVQ